MIFNASNNHLKVDVKTNKDDYNLLAIYAVFVR